jgi:hypothetical protein
MIAARNDRTIRDVGHSVAIGDKHFEVVKEFVYQGSLMMTYKNDVSLDSRTRIPDCKKMLLWTVKTSAAEPHFTLDKIHHPQDLDPPSLYGSETWMLTSYLRGYAARKSKMVSTGGSLTTNSIKSLIALNVTKTSRLHHAGHMIRRPEDLP